MPTFNLFLFENVPNPFPSSHVPVKNSPSMAIINAKRIEAEEEAERNDRRNVEEYASRHDTAWQQPPPAYEEAAAEASASRNTRPADETNASERENVQEEMGFRQQNRERNTERRRERRRDQSTRFIEGDIEREGEIESDQESMPLLTRRQNILLKKKLRFNSKYRRSCRFMAALLLIAIVILLFFDLFTNDGKREKIEPWPSDGRPVEGPNWSPIEETPKDTWISPNLKQYTCNTSFSLPANASLAFVRAHGIAFTGLLRTGSADEVTKKEWNLIHGGPGLDRIAVIVQARFTHSSLFDSVTVNKMIDEKDQKNIAQGISLNGFGIPTGGNEFLSFTINVLLPDPTFRSKNGLARDGTSFIPGLDLFADNLRIVYEGFAQPYRDGRIPGVSFGKITANARIAGISLGMKLIANESISMRVENGQIRDIYFTEVLPFTVAAPHVELQTLNGPIWISGVVAIDEINLHTISGGLNVSQIAVAKKIRCSTRDGVLGGKYAALDSFSASTTTADVKVDVVAHKDAYRKYLQESGLLSIIDPQKAKDLIKELTASSSWRKLEVEAYTQMGTSFVNYIDQDHETQLKSNVTSITGLVDVTHSRAFEGRFEVETIIGSIVITEPDYGKPNRKKTFVVDLGGDEGKVGKFFKGRTWFLHHGWESVGPDRNSLYPLSHSRMFSNIGRIQGTFK